VPSPLQSSSVRSLVHPQLASHPSLPVLSQRLLEASRRCLLEVFHLAHHHSPLVVFQASLVEHLHSPLAASLAFQVALLRSQLEVSLVFPAAVHDQGLLDQAPVSGLLSCVKENVMLIYSSTCAYSHRSSSLVLLIAIVAGTARSDGDV
jgi:hypothetical protein